jgi:cytochrome c556
MRKLLLGGLVVVFGIGGVAQAADTPALKPDSIIATRQAGYDVVQGNLSAMKAAVASGASVKPLADGAKGFVSWGNVIPSLFPAGTETGHKTKAKPEIWSDTAGFQKDAANFVAAAQKLETLADADDKAGFAAQFKVVGEACGACHRGYRAR